MILYALISRGKNVLCEVTKFGGNFPTVTRVLLSKINVDIDSKMSYIYDGYIFHYIIDSGMIFMCMCEGDSKKRTSFAFLEDVKSIWRRKYSTVEQTAVAFSMQSEFSDTLTNKIDYYNQNPSADNIDKIRGQLESVREVMCENIEQLLERGEKLELLVDKTDRLNQSAFKFEKSAKVLKHSMWCRRAKLYGVICFVILVNFLSAQFSTIPLT